MSLSLAGSASAATGGSADILIEPNAALNHEITLGEEELSDVSLGTFYVFDKENAAGLQSGIKVARGCRGCGCGGRGCGGCGRGCGGCGGRGCGGWWWGGCGCGCGCYGYGYGCCLSWGGCRYC